MSLVAAQRRGEAALNRVAKWRTVFAGWQLGTRANGDPESDAVRDTRELLILLRVELSALTSTLLDRGVIQQEHFLITIADEAEALSKSYEGRFPGATATDQGISFDIGRTAEIQTWMKDWKP